MPQQADWCAQPRGSKEPCLVVNAVAWQLLESALALGNSTSSTHQLRSISDEAHRAMAIAMNRVGGIATNSYKQVGGKFSEVV
eukprot:6490880-Amphidinium_carterae.3